MNELIQVHGTVSTALNNVTMDFMNLPVDVVSDWNKMKKVVKELDEQMFGMPGRLVKDIEIYKTIYKEFVSEYKRIPEILDIYDDILEESYGVYEKLNDMHLLHYLINDGSYGLVEQYNDSDSVEEIEETIKVSLACVTDYCGTYEDYVRAEHYDTNGYDNSFSIFTYLVDIANITKLALSKGNLSEGYPLFVEIAGSDQNILLPELNEGGTIMIKNDNWQDAVIKKMRRR